MKRPPGIWILLSAGVLWLSLQDVYGIRATALIFGKSTTTTTEATSPDAASNETATEASTEVSNVTKPTLTGIPQLDYIYEPNLPQELNGYNLSEYPFYERVPEEINFKCDGLHDGFYASVPHKCQVYHHCLFGTRYDFLCANYTAFDQKTFICHFVSEVDCVHSKKYWHRNDALYEAASTTTVKPPVIVYTRPSEPHPASAQAPGPGGAGSPRRPGGRRRPLRRRRPQYEYYDYDDEYDDYYDERPSRSESRRRKRPRPRPRPIYDDDYEEEEEEERYERRGSGRRDEDRRQSYDRRGSDDRRDRRRNKDRRKYDDDKLEEEDKLEDDRMSDKRSGDDRTSDKRSEDDRTSDKRPGDDRMSDKRSGERRYHKRRPIDDHSGEEEEEVRKEDRRRSRPKNSRRPIADDYEDEEKPSHSSKSTPAEPSSEKPMIKPTSGSSIYDRPRAAPKIKPPVPKNEASKYAYKAASTKPPPFADDEEYYDDYEEEPPKSHRKSEASESRRHLSRREEERETRKPPTSTRLRTSQSTRDDSYEEEAAPRRPYKPKYGSQRERQRVTSTSKKPPIVDDYYDEYEEDISKENTKLESKSAERHREKSVTSTTTSTTTTTTTLKPTTTRTTTTTTTTTPKPITTIVKEVRPESIVRIVKRPFLPSRGGSPYTSRGLQPVGAKAVDKKPEPIEETELEDEPIFKASPVIKMPSRQKYVQSPADSSQEEFKPVSNRPQLAPRPTMKPNKDFSGPRTTQKPKLPDPDPLDIEEDEYDVTLNDALNPTLPNLPVRGYPAGFSSANDYNYNNYQRPRYVLEEATSNYYQAKPARQRYEAVSYNNNAQDHLVNSDAEYKGQYSTINRESLRPRLTQAYYTRF